MKYCCCRGSNCQPPTTVCRLIPDKRTVLVVRTQSPVMYLQRARRAKQALLDGPPPPGPGGGGREGVGLAGVLSPEDRPCHDVSAAEPSAEGAAPSVPARSPRPPSCSVAAAAGKRARRRACRCRARGRCASPSPCPFPPPPPSPSSALPVPASPSPSPPPSLPRVMSSHDDGPPFSAPARMLRGTPRTPLACAAGARRGRHAPRLGTAAASANPWQDCVVDSVALFRMVCFAAATCAKKYGNLSYSRLGRESAFNTSF